MSAFLRRLGEENAVVGHDPDLRIGGPAANHERSHALHRVPLIAPEGRTVRRHPANMDLVAVDGAKAADESRPVVALELR
eukprot:scaffold106535_cov35-Tisochrysis_lutea.AAC.3